MTVPVLARSDIALLADIAGSRIVMDHLIVADPQESWDSALVWFDDGDAGQLPVEYRGKGRSGTLQCTARFTHNQHADLVALLELFTTARQAADARLQLRTNAGLVEGVDEAYVGVVPSWSRPRVVGQTHDVQFDFLRTA